MPWPELQQKGSNLQKIIIVNILIKMNRFKSTFKIFPNILKMDLFTKWKQGLHEIVIHDRIDLLVPKSDIITDF